MKDALRFTTGAALTLIMEPLLLRSITRKPIWFPTPQDRAGHRPSVDQPLGTVAQFQQPLGISDNGQDSVRSYNGPGAKQPLFVTIPPADPNNKNTPQGTPTGTIANSSQTDLLLAPRQTQFVPLLHD